MYLEFDVLIKDLIVALRTGDYGNASSYLNELLQSFQNSLHKGNCEDSKLKKILISLQTIFFMQKMEDWVAVADLIEYEFIGLWKDLQM